MLVAGFPFMNGSIKLKQDVDGFHLEIYHDKYLVFAKTITDETKAKQVYSMAKEILTSETDKGFLAGVELVATSLGYTNECK